MLHTNQFFGGEGGKGNAIFGKNIAEMPAVDDDVEYQSGAQLGPDRASGCNDRIFAPLDLRPST